MIEAVELAYVAGVVDTQAVIRTRALEGGTLLPMVAVHGPNARLLDYLANTTGTRVTTVRRGYSKAGCSDHCPDQHQHITSTSGRWSVTGVKATVLLCAVRPHLRLQGYDADEAIDVGLVAPRKPATLGRMTALGWPTPEPWLLTPLPGQKVLA